MKSGNFVLIKLLTAILVASLWIDSVALCQEADPNEEDDGRTRHDAIPSPDGVLRFPALPTGKMVRLRAFASGFVEHEEEVDVLLRADDGERMELVLMRGVTIRGVVLDAATREPVAAARVWADSYRFDMGWMPPRTTADETGRFVLFLCNDKPVSTEGCRPVPVLEGGEGPTRRCQGRLDLIFGVMAFIRFRLTTRGILYRRRLPV